jgi:hypothetical protein
MEKIRINYGVQGNGMTFGLDSDDYKAIKKSFPNAQPAKRIFVEYDLRSDFKKNHAQLEKYVFPALVGMTNEEDLKKIRKIEFYYSLEGKVTYIIEQNYEPQTESLSR